MSAQTLLSRLEHVREIHPGQWRAKCPAHDGKSPDSLSIAETRDGTVLLHCFGGCEAEDITAAVGMALRDLFPDRDLSPTERRNYARKAAARDARLVLRHELLVLQQCNDARLKREPLIDPDPEGRERIAVGRIRNVLEALYA